MQIGYEIHILQPFSRRVLSDRTQPEPLDPTL